MDVLHYLTDEGVDPFQVWLESLADSKAQYAVFQRVTRLAAGNAGDHCFCRGGIWELRIDTGPGYRVYFARPVPDEVLLLHGGTKRTQRRDIMRAIERWTDFQRRVNRRRH